jgi:ADP-ribosylglycohydrolase/catechol 2,3-dioxygenase-like lactoylglutathione lyase family enzyme
MPPFIADPERVRGLLVGAAVGDALGWPQEDRNNIVGGARARDVEPKARYRAWRRNAGTQFARYEDPVGQGEYSDDTQLLLAVARACIRGEDWLRWLTEVELPTWLLYQRGGGRAVLSASRAWSEGHPPWVAASAKDAGRTSAYFNAGANGVAMRIAPHAVAVTDSEELLERIIADGIATHGHPRALVGACVHGLAARHALQRQGTLGYGDLIHAVMDNHAWRDDALLGRIAPSEWHDGFRRSLGEDPAVVWKTTVDEMTDLLRLADDALRAGAMANDEDVLERMGCFDKKRNGAGTISAAAALYVAARSAARPASGLVRAAFLKRADTDTLASMTASLLGAVHEVDWMNSLAPTVQDYDYLSETAYRLARGPSASSEVLSEVENWRGDVRSLSRFRESLGDSQASAMLLTDGRPFEVLDRVFLQTKSNATVERVLGRTADGQHLFFDKLSRGRRTESPRVDSVDDHSTDSARNDLRHSEATSRSGSSESARITEVRLKVRDLDRAARFYGDTFGIECERQTDKTVLVGSLMVLQKARPDESTGATHRLMLTIAVKSISDVIMRLDEEGHPYNRGSAHGGKHLWLRDLDGHAVNVFEPPTGWVF